MVNKTSAIAKYIKIIVSDTRNDKISSHLLFGLLVKKFGEQLGRLSEQEFQSGVDAAAAQGIIERTNTNDFLIKKTNLHHHQNNNFRPHQQSYKGDENAPRVKGTIHLNAAGNGFITLIGEQKATFYVQKTNVNGAQDGDIVEAVKTNFDTPGDLIDAKVMEVIEHSKDYYVGEFALDKLGKYQVILDDQKNTLKIMLNNINGLVNGSKILIHVTDYKANGIAYGEVTKILGHKTDVGVDIMSIVYDNGVNPDFSDEVLNYAKTIKLDIDEEQARVRTDLSDKPIITIDPATSKDFDDAFYCEKRGEKYFLSVSIADVSHYVKYDDILDKEALRRGCSIYLVDRVIPMLPHNLSDDLCSIVEHQPRFALTCDMVINKTGETEDIKVYPTIINSHRRFSYDEVNDYFANHQVFEKEEKAVVQSIDVGLELSDILKKMKDARGYIAFDVPKANIVVDEHGEPVDITREVHGRAQEMIEDFMVAANEAVTVYAKKHNFPFVYRIHEKPDEKRLATFAIEAKKLGFKITTDIDDIKPHDISEWLEFNKNNPNTDLINFLLLTSMSKAKYDVKNIGHFGLASLNYTHFTSPIRRYPDLMVHRIFWMYDFLKDTTAPTTRTKFTNELEEDCVLSSKNEMVAQKCEREVNALKFAEYMRKRIGQQYEASIVNISSSFISAQLDNTICGTIGIKNLGNDFYTYNPNTNELVGRTGTRFYIGMHVLIEVVDVNLKTRKIDFKLIKVLPNKIYSKPKI